jgi:hypothetical protein
MPRYLSQPNEYGYHASVTGYLPPHEAVGLTEYTGQTLPCWPDGTPLTGQEIADIEAQKEQARIQSLVSKYSQSVQTLVQCLAPFGVVMPVDFEEARQTMFSQSLDTPAMLPYAVMAGEIYKELRTVMSDHDIYMISEETA